MPSNLIRNLAWALFFMGILVGVARLTCLRWWQVPEDDPTLTTSLEPTLHAGDWLILWRLTPPGYGDLVMCPDPGEAGEIVVGRIAAESGDRLSIDEDGSLMVNNSRAISERHCKRASFEVSHPRTGAAVELRCDIETLGGVHHQRGLKPQGGLRPMPVNVTVPSGQLYLVSDNRFYPFDSREYGPVPQESCTETVIFRLVSRLGFFDTESRLNLIQ
ncbi:MAG TPA: signal peptidase I [Polyangiaceae bacterium]|nr:signal peptidase I [Polyangiaceae bacterium]